MPFSIIYITNETEAAAQIIVDKLLQKRLIACANIFPISYVYWWQEAIEKGNEYVAIVKTTHEKWEAVCQEIEQIHPYEVPCIMRMQVEANSTYEAWIKEAVSDN